MSVRLFCFPVMLALTLAGCGRDIVVGGQQEGEVRTVATSDGTTSGSAAARVPIEAGTITPAFGAPAAAARGTVTFAASVTLISDAGEEVVVTNGLSTAQVQIEGPDTTLVGQARVRAATYTRARVEFARVDADVTGGLVIGGIPLLGLIRVEIGANERVIVEAPIQMTVEPKTSETLVVDLNASTWLLSANRLTGLVPAASLRSAVRLRVQ
jgi:hypothetical protein